MVKGQGHVLLLEHVRSPNPVLGKVFDLLTSLPSGLIGPEINRRVEGKTPFGRFVIVDVRRDGI